MQPLIAVDLDGTIFEYKEWKGTDHFGKPIKGVKKSLKFLQKLGYRIVIHTTRTNHLVNNEPPKVLYWKVRKELEKHGIPFNKIYTIGKPPAEFFIDDRAVQFKGDWEETLKEIISRRD